MRCVECGHETTNAGVVDELVRVGELSYTVEAPALVCPSCGETYLSAETLQQIGALVATDLAREGVGTPEAFRYMRKKLQLPAKELAVLFDVSPEAVSRWEHGVHQPDARAVRLLGAMVLESLGEPPRLLEYLRSLTKDRAQRGSGRRLSALRAAGS